ncbi:KHG/KDPG aldolase isoform X7 [Momordica charantia]|uniref:KHG/KDPG aldolase isoform X7 n=1 Tax=Momordica charantia TaxID=3673 RepID=A0A6J1CBX3_MOMCH|nr:KHG/KDPG aldolase isoform X7 [Momordica charantia]
MLVSRRINMWSLPAIGYCNPFACARFTVFCASRQLSVSPKDKTLKKIYNSGVIACLRASSAELAMSAACAALNGGVSVLEIVTSTPGVFEVLQQLLQDYPTKTVGVGTVLNIKDAKDAVKGGAKFLMSPTMVKGIMDDIEDEFLYIPGVMTPTEILTAYEAGAEIVKTQ